LLRDILAEEDDVGLEPPAAGCAPGYDEVPGVVEFDIAVGADRRAGVDIGVTGIGEGHRRLDRRTSRDRAAVEATHLADPAVQFDQVVLPGTTVQPVDILGDHQLAGQHGEQPVPVVGIGRGHPRPADMGARPVAPLVVGARHEVLIGHRHPYRRITGGPWTAIVGDPGVGGDAGAGERDEPTAVEQVDRAAGVLHQA